MTNIQEIMNTMDYGTAPESSKEADAWLDTHNRAFGHFIDGAFTAPANGFETKNPATGSKLATISQATQDDIDAAVRAATKVQGKWEKLGGAGRARVLYALARLLQKHARLFAVLETLDNGKPIREARDIDIPLAQRHFYYHAGMAQIMDVERPDARAHGVCGQIIPWNFPLLMLAWKVAPALATGNTVVLKPAEYTSLTALLFAEICVQAGVPKGVVNIITGDGAAGEMIVNHPDIAKIAFTGSTEVGRIIRERTAGTGKSLTLELGGKSPFIVFDDADLDSAVEGVVDAIWFNQGQVCCAGSRLLLHAPIADAFTRKLKARMAKLRVGDPMDKSIDIGAIVDQSQLERIQNMVAGCQDGSCFQPEISVPNTGNFYPPTLITDLSPSDPLMQDEIFGPVLVSTTFRTPSEAVALANNTRYGLAASVWSENINLTLGVAPKLAAGVVWINGTNMFDAAAGFGGKRESGFGREGGWEGLDAYIRPYSSGKQIKPVTPFTGKDTGPDGIDRTAKLYIGGKQARPDGGYYRAQFDKSGALIAHIPIAGRKDVRNAVEAATGATGWAGATAHLRAQILYYIGENLSQRADEFAASINRQTGSNSGQKEVEASIDRLFTYAAYADKFDGSTRAVPLRGTALVMPEPLGVIGAICPEEAPLLGFVSLMAPIIAMGNRAVMVAGEAFPLAALEMIQVLETSDVPGGVVNILTGPHMELARTLGTHMGVDGLWSFASAEVSHLVEKTSTSNLKRTYVNHGCAMDWYAPTPRAFLNAATEAKTIWIPYGE